MAAAHVRVLYPSTGLSRETQSSSEGVYRMRLDGCAKMRVTLPRTPAETR
jgi:hypothetical protein